MNEQEAKVYMKVFETVDKKIKRLETDLEYQTQQRERLSRHNSELEQAHVNVKQQLAIASRRLEYLDQQRGRLSEHNAYLEQEYADLKAAHMKYINEVYKASFLARLCYLITSDFVAEVEFNRAIGWLWFRLLSKLGIQKPA